MGRRPRLPKLERRARPSSVMRIASPLIAAAAMLVTGFVVFLLLGYPVALAIARTPASRRGPLLMAVIPAALVIAGVTAIMPGRSAAHTRAAQALRAE